MTPDEKRELAANVLARGKLLAPDRFPQPSADVIEAWGRVLGSINLPALVWAEAVDLWALELVGTRMATPRELKDAARAVLVRWESDPVRAPQLRAHRERLTIERDKQIADGSFGHLRGYQPRKITQQAQPAKAIGGKYKRRGETCPTATEHPSTRPTKSTTQSTSTAPNATPQTANTAKTKKA